MGAKKSVACYIKDLRILMENRSLADIVIIDDKVASYAIQIENGIPIKRFEGDSTDTHLQQVCKFLMEKVKDAADVRDVIKAQKFYKAAQSTL